MNASVFETSWNRAWQGLHAAGSGLAVRDGVLARYAEPHRKYHTLQHLEECLTLFEAVQHAPDRPAEVEMAIWFHDAIYELCGSSDNERASADWAHEELRAAGVASEIADRVHALILITKHSGVPQTRDEQVLLDVDLSILGSAPARFAEYELQIREEYGHVPGFLFRMKRRAILKSFLDRLAIYSTPLLREQLEKQARINLTKAIAGAA